jgi:CHASE2 domain-containing sensor protein
MRKFITTFIGLTFAGAVIVAVCFGAIWLLGEHPMIFAIVFFFIVILWVTFMYLEKDGEE